MIIFDFFFLSNCIYYLWKIYKILYFDCIVRLKICVWNVFRCMGKMYICMNYINLEYVRYIKEIWFSWDWSKDWK